MSTQWKKLFSRCLLTLTAASLVSESASTAIAQNKSIKTGGKQPIQLNIRNDRKATLRKLTHLQKNTLARHKLRPAPLQDLGDFYRIGGDSLLDKKDPVHRAIVQALKDPKQRRPNITVPKTKPRRLLDPQGDVGVVRSALTAGRGAFISKWPHGMVPYYYDTQFSISQRRAIEDAMRTIEDVCGVNFYETTGPRPYRLRIKKSDDPNVGGSATVGRTIASTFHYNSPNQGTLVHELLHVLGFIHEHQRHDRDRFVKINWDNIRDQYKHNYDKLPENAGILFLLPGRRESLPLTTYDYRSIMHYPASAPSFSIDRSKPNIERVDGRPLIRSRSLSSLDKQGLVHYYGPSRRKLYLTSGEGFALRLWVRELAQIGKSPDRFGKPDYYWTLEIKDDVSHFTKWQSVEVEDKTTASHPNWRAWRFFDHAVYSAYPKINCTLRVWDDDGGLRGKDDRCDINPRRGAKHVSFSIDTRTGRIRGDLNGTLGRDITSTGNGDDNHTRIKLRLTRENVRATSRSAVARHFYKAFHNGAVSMKFHNELVWYTHRGGKAH